MPEPSLDPEDDQNLPSAVNRHLPRGLHPLGRAFTDESDLVPLFLLRFDRPNTRRAYQQDLSSFFQSDYVSLDIAQRVSFTDVNSFIERLQDGGSPPSTIRRRLAAVRAFFAWLVALGQLTLNPADRHLVRRISKENAKERTVTVLTREATERLLGAIDQTSSVGIRDYALVSTLLNCVLRRSEATAMDVEHLQQMGPYWVIRLPSAKGGANQTVKMPSHVVESIRLVLEDQDFSSGPIWRSLSRNSLGRRLSGSSVYSIVAKYAAIAGLTDTVGAHTLRHTGCTLAIEAGASIQQVQTHARHKNIETTMLYVHQRDRLAHSAADFIGLGGASTARAEGE